MSGLLLCGCPAESRSSGGKKDAGGVQDTVEPADVEADAAVTDSVESDIVEQDTVVPDAAESDAETPDAEPPDAEPPDAEPPDAEPPDVAPDTTEPDTTEPDTTEPDTTEPDVVEPPPSCGKTIPDFNVNACPPEEALWPGIDLEDFDSIPELKDFDITALHPDPPVTYWELRFSGLGGDTDDVIWSAGDKCAAAADTDACKTAFDALDAAVGFAPGCMPGYCFMYLAVNSGDDNYVVDNGKDLAEFLAPIDSAAEAALVVRGHGYTWGNDKSTGGVRAIAGGYELLVGGLASGCLPVASGRYLMRVYTDGTAEVLCDQLYSVLCGACI